MDGDDAHLPAIFLAGQHNTYVKHQPCLPSFWRGGDGAADGKGGERHGKLSIVSLLGRMKGKLSGWECEKICGEMQGWQVVHVAPLKRLMKGENLHHNGDVKHQPCRPSFADPKGSFGEALLRDWRSGNGAADGNRGKGPRRLRISPARRSGGDCRFPMAKVINGAMDQIRYAYTAYLSWFLL